MTNQALKSTFLPELGSLRGGKVRDIYEQDDRLTMITSDRISMFDRVFLEPIPDKGRILTSISNFWFENTKDIVPNHIIATPDPNVIIVKKCKPIMVEMIVRGFLVGSLWRDYVAGKREKCGILLPDGLKENDPLPASIVTPTTKSPNGHDEDITASDLIKEGIVTKEQWQKLEKISFQLFKKGQTVAKERGLILVDTKYEFGLDEQGQIILIDEVHTPDSSRYWFKKDLDIRQVRFPDKEFARSWARNLSFEGEGDIPNIPQEIIEKIRSGYEQVFETITGQKLTKEDQSTQLRLLKNLKEAKIIKGKCVLLLVGSEKDFPHVEKITNTLLEFDIPYQISVASAHKSPKEVLKVIDQYNESIEPVVCITVAGKSNALSGVVASNLKWPTIACPPFKDYSDYLVNIHSSLQMPSDVSVMTVIDPKNAALAAKKILEIAL